MKSTRFPDLPPLAPLLVFEAAAFHGSFSRAASELHISSAAVAHHIKKLEASINTQLFLRHARGVSLTAQGQEYFSQIHRQLSELQNFSVRLRDLSRQPVRIKTQHAIAQLWLQPRLNAYQQINQDHEFEITATSLIDTSPHDTDIALAFFAQPPSSPHWTRLWHESLIAVKGPKLDAQQAVLYLDAHWQSDWDIWSAEPHNQALVSPTRKRRASLYVLVLQSVLDNQGIMIARESLLMTHLQQRQLIALPDSIAVEHGAYYLFESPNSAQNPAVSEFCQWLKSITGSVIQNN